MTINSKRDKERKFEEYRKYLAREVTRLVNSAEILRRFHEHRYDRLEELNLAPAFFGTTRDALFSEVVIWTDKLLDEKGERGLFNFLIFIEQNLDLFSKEELKRRGNLSDSHRLLNSDPPDKEKVYDDRNRLKRLDGIKKINLLRDTYFAHFDKKFFFDRKQMEEEGTINWGELDNILEAISKLANDYSIAYDGNEYKFKAQNVDDIDSLLDYLHEWRHQAGR